VDEFEKRVIDYFDPDQLIDLLGVTTEEVVEAFLEKIKENTYLLEDFMQHGR